MGGPVRAGSSKENKVAWDAHNDLIFWYACRTHKLKGLIEGIFEIRQFKVVFAPSNSKVNTRRSMLKIKNSLD